MGDLRQLTLRILYQVKTDAAAARPDGPNLIWPTHCRRAVS